MHSPQAIDGRNDDPVAIVGVSFRFPPDVVSEDEFWSLLESGRNVVSEMPSDRMNIDAFHGSNEVATDKLPLRGGHFLGNISCFDAPFFNMGPAEATGLDPIHRGMLETTYRALENAGIPMDKAAGSRTSVHIGFFGSDYVALQTRDPLKPSQYSATGVSQSFIANRLSWFFDFKGPSMSVDTACSSSLVALDLGCEAILAKGCTMGIVGGAGLFFDPYQATALANVKALSPDSRSYSFDARANGYGRGEGFGVVVLKRLSQAVKDGDTVRAVIRSTMTNTDGKTPAITQPSAAVQEALICDTYHQAGLDMSETSYFEAHATGTPVGDPIEVSAVASAFKNYTSPGRPLTMGAVKANIGHLEGASGVSAIVKTVLMLERGIIPPIADLQQLNPKIDTEAVGLEFPRETRAWSGSRLRRVSVNSFGLGGANAHVVLDDAYHYLHDRNIEANHRTVASYNDDTTTHVQCDAVPLTPSDKLLILSAFDEPGIKRMARAYTEHFNSLRMDMSKQSAYLELLVSTLNFHRTSLPWKSAAVISSFDQLRNLSQSLLRPVRSSSKCRLGFVFTGQGSHWTGMGRELLGNEVFKASLEKSTQLVSNLGSSWNLIDELLLDGLASRIDDPAVCQPLCTALQIALVDLLHACSIRPSVVVGHSSGEIAAAYCAGSISRQYAIRLAYLRGALAAELARLKHANGGMLAVGMSEIGIRPYLAKTINGLKAPELVVGCINSPKNVTVAGPRSQIEDLKCTLDQKGVFARLLPVNVAYHSPQMYPIATQYSHMIGDAEPVEHDKAMGQQIQMFSSLTGAETSADEVRSARYWMDNLTNPVKFSDAVREIIAGRPEKLDKNEAPSRRPPTATHFIEVGAHAVLKGPLRDIITECFPGNEANYISLMKRGVSASKTFFEVMGQLHCWGEHVNLAKVASLQGINDAKREKILTNLPPYQFNHTRSYWHESKMNEGIRLRRFPRLSLLGAPTPDWNPLEPKWRNLLRESELPWVEDHKINGTPIVPAAGMIVCAIEAAKQLADEGKVISAYKLRDVQLQNWLTVGTANEEIESHFYLRRDTRRTTRNCPWFDFRLTSFQSDRWVENCSGSLQLEYQDEQKATHVLDEESARQLRVQNLLQHHERECTKTSDSSYFYSNMASLGFEYGPAFQLLTNLRINEKNSAVGDVRLSPLNTSEHLHSPTPLTIHPTTLDCLLQLSYVAWTKGGNEAVPTAIPRSIETLWISSTGLSLLGDSPLKAYTSGHFGSPESQIAAFNPETNELLAIVEGAKLAVTAGEQENSLDTENSTLLAYHRAVKPDFTLLKQEQIFEYCQQFEKSGTEPVEVFNDVHRAVLAAMWHAVRHFKAQGRIPTAPHLQRYFSWIERLVQDVENGHNDMFHREWLSFPTDDDSRSILLGRLKENHGSRGVFYATVAEHLISILEEKADVHELLFAGALARDYYRQTATESKCNAASAHFIDLLAHKNPGMKILEIGAGTGGYTATALEALAGGEVGDESLPRRYAQFDFTDISKSFFSDAQEIFCAEGDRLDFKVLDIETDPEAQSFEAASYDLILAASVLHATRDLKKTLENVRCLLKPGGILIIVEVTELDKLSIPFAWGLFEGWWLSEDDRHNGPCVTVSQWSDLLRSTGFSGADMAFPDYENHECREISVIVSTAVESNVMDADPHDVKVIIDEDSALQKQMSEIIKKFLLTNSHASCAIVSLQGAAAAAKESKDVVCISLLELGSTFLRDIQHQQFQHLNVLAHNARLILWITHPDKCNDYAATRMIDGFSRVVRLERPAGVAFITFAFHTETDEVEIAEDITKVFHKSIGEVDRNDSYERELVKSTSLIQIPRIERDMNTTSQMRRAHQSTQSLVAEFGSVSRLKMSIKTPGLLDTICFAEDVSCDSPLAPDDVEIEIKAVGLNFRDVLAALGRFDGEVGFEAAGIVTRACPVSNLLPGDKVAGFVRGAFRTRARNDYRCLTRIPETFSFASAAAIPCCFGTAYYALHQVAHLQPREKILIHAAAGGTGQAAVQIAQWLGAEVFATVGSQEKRNLLTEQYNIAGDHIFNSRDVSFAQGIMRMTERQGVDVVLNSLSGQALFTSFECCAPFGRFIEIGKGDIMTKGTLPMQPFINNVSFHCVDLSQLMEKRPAILRQANLGVMKLFHEKRLRIIHPLTTFPISAVEQAFRLMQSGKSMGKLVVEINSTDEVPMTLSTKTNWSFSAGATFVIAGAFGGLGRDLAMWLVDRGARNLLLLSRSGAATAVAQALIQELDERGVKTSAPKCDISDSDDLQRAVDSCMTEMPPIKGCVQASLVLQDSILENMTYEDWKVPIAAKVHGSWNLHQVLPSGMQLFVMLSSSVGILGNHGQANYAAANTYQDALARHRISLGESALSIDLPLMSETDSFSVTKEAAERLEAGAKIATMAPKELHALMDYYCDPSERSISHTNCQPILGIITPTELRARGFDQHEYLYEPAWRPLWNIRINSNGPGGSDAIEDFTALFKAAVTPNDATDVIIRAMIKKLARSLAVPEEDIDVEQALSTYGVDSLVGVELRNWFSRVFVAEMAVFDILGGGTLAAVAKLAAERSKLR